MTASNPDIASKNTIVTGGEHTQSSLDFTGSGKSQSFEPLHTRLVGGTGKH